MISVVKIISTKIDKTMRFIKALRKGKSDVQETYEISPFGVDSNPIADMAALYLTTEENGKTVIIGYINKGQLAEPGEVRHYSLDAEGALKFYTWLKADGTLELGGVAHNIVRYTPLNTGLQNEATLINAELAKIAVAINALAPGAYVVAPISVNISTAKVDEIKCL